MRASGTANHARAVLGGPADPGQPGGRPGRVSTRCSHAVFGDAFAGRTRSAQRRGPGDARRDGAVPGWADRGAAPAMRRRTACRGRPGRRRCGAGGADRRGIALPDALPSRLVARGRRAVRRFDADDLRLIGTWLEQAVGALAASGAACGERASTRTASGSTCGATMRRVAHDRLGSGAAGAHPARAVDRGGSCWSAT